MEIATASLNSLAQSRLQWDKYLLAIDSTCPLLLAEIFLSIRGPVLAPTTPAVTPTAPEDTASSLLILVEEEENEEEEEQEEEEVVAGVGNNIAGRGIGTGIGIDIG